MNLIRRYWQDGPFAFATDVLLVLCGVVLLALMMITWHEGRWVPRIILFIGGLSCIFEPHLVRSAHVSPWFFRGSLDINSPLRTVAAALALLGCLLWAFLLWFLFWVPL